MIICGSRFVREAIRAEGGPVEKAVVVPLGIHEDYQMEPQFDRHASPLRVLFVGDDGLRKGVADLAQAAALLGSDQVDIRVAGRLELTTEGRRQLQKHVLLLGHVARQQMAQQYRWADVLALPSVSDTFALVILEAMSAGVPVITTPNTGGRDVLEDGIEGFIVPIRSPEAIAERLTRLADDRQLLCEMSENAAARAREFTWDRYAERLLTAIGHHRRPDRANCPK
jgi:glycosyltransferase involved in cell wall biosynthesis